MEMGFVSQRVIKFPLVAVCAALMVVPLAGASSNIVLETRDTYDTDMIDSICTGSGPIQADLALAGV